MWSYMCFKTRSHTIKCCSSRTTTYRCHSEADAQW